MNDTNNEQTIQFGVELNENYSKYDEILLMINLYTREVITSNELYTPIDDLAFSSISFANYSLNDANLYVYNSIPLPITAFTTWRHYSPTKKRKKSKFRHSSSTCYVH